MILDRINQPGDIRKISPEDYDILAKEIRSFLIERTSNKGGHLASNLGVVELTMALHLVFDPMKDRIIWDVGHQSYVHKLLTGRKDAFDHLREFGGISGFPKRKESPADAFDTGHSSTSISAGLGLVEAREQLGQKHAVITVIGDGALTGGMAWEALNNVSNCNSNFIIILNDNEMSIARNTGGISKHLNKIRSTQNYNVLKERVHTGLDAVSFGEPISRTLSTLKRGFKRIAFQDMLFENMGIKYWGPVDGHNLDDLVEVLSSARMLKKPVLIHIKTRKGLGYPPAEEHPEKFHGVSPFEIKSGKPKKVKTSPDWTNIFSQSLCAAAREDKRIVAITAAMPDGTGLAAFAREFPERFYDIGIAEQHAVTFAAGMAQGGLKPVFAVYSSFLQRGYDQVVHDVCTQDLPVVFAVDRAGLVGADGETHQGILDLSFLSGIPGMTVCAPKNGWELDAMLKFALEYEHPIAVRYPRGTAWRGLEDYKAPIEPGKAEWIQEGKRVALLAIGSMMDTAVEIRERLSLHGIEAGLVNMRFVSPLDEESLAKAAREYEVIVTLEENVWTGGMGARISDWLMRHKASVSLVNVAIPDVFVEHGQVSELRRMLEMDAEHVTKRILDALGID